MFKNDKPQAEHYPAGDQVILNRIEVLSRAVNNVIQYGGIVIDSRQSAEVQTLQPQNDQSKSLRTAEPVQPSVTLSPESGFITIESARHQVDDFFGDRDKAA